MKLVFHSDTNYQQFCEYLDYRYPTNLLEFQPETCSISFLGDAPDHQIMTLAHDLSCEVELT